MTRRNMALAACDILLVCLLVYDVSKWHDGHNADFLADAAVNAVILVLMALWEIGAAIRERKPPVFNVEVYQSPNGRARVEGDEWKDT